MEKSGPYKPQSTYHQHNTFYIFLQAQVLIYPAVQFTDYDTESQQVYKDGPVSKKYALLLSALLCHNVHYAHNDMSGVQ